MIKKLLKLLFIILLPCPLQLFSQDITGLWKGTLYNDTTKQFLNYELAVSENNGKLTAYSYTVFDVDGKKEVGVKKLTVKRKGNNILLDDDDMLSNNYSIKPPKGVHQSSDLTLSVSDTVMMLEGKWRTNRTRYYSSLTGTIQLKRRSDYKQSDLFTKLNELKIADKLSFNPPDKKAEPVVVKKQDTVKPAVAVAKKPKVARAEKPAEPVVVQAAADFNKRKTTSIRSVFYESDSLLLTLYDNGEIDGDTVSVLMNGKVIIPRQGLNTKPNSKTIYINNDTPDSMLLEMYAENLGSIPPNTGLLIVHDGEKEYEVFFTADLETNAAIILRRKKK